MGGAVVALTLLALVLRCVGLDGPLWLDEVATIRDVHPLSVGQVFTTWTGTNNHLSTTLLTKALAGLFGHAEWAMRLPAMLAGVALVPATWYAARTALPDRAALLAAALVAVSSHHVAFSQNARGYTAWLLFSTLGTALLVRALRAPSRGLWVAFSAASFLNFTSILLSSVVFVVHGALAAWLLLPSRRGRRTWATVFLGTGALGLLLYGPVLLDAVTYVGDEYGQAGVGFHLLSPAFLAELWRGLHLGTAGVVALPIAAFIGVLGALRLGREAPVLLGGLLGPPLLLGGVVLLAGVSSTPRHFLLLLPAAFVVGSAGLETLAGRLSGRLGPALLAAAGVVFAVASAPQLARLYRTPKQDIPGALRWVRSERQPGQQVAALFLATKPVAHYADEALGSHEDLHLVRSPEAFAAARAAGGPPLLVISTFAGALHHLEPTLETELHHDFVEVARFPGTIGDADVTVWRERPPTSPRTVAPAPGR